MKKTIRFFLYLFFLCLIGEIGLRVASHHFFNTPFWDVRHLLGDPYVLWKYNPGSSVRICQFNQNGFWGKELQQPKKTNTLRIVALGGSVSFGFGSTCLEGNFCSSLETTLNRKSGPYYYEVVNASVTGYSSYNGHQFVEHYLHTLQADVLLVAYGWNDSLEDLAPDSDPKDRDKRRLMRIPKPLPENFLLVRQFQSLPNILLRKFTRVLKDPIPAHTVEVPRVSPQEFEANLGAIQRWCTDHQVKLMFWTEPAPLESQAGKRSSTNARVYHDILRQISSHQQIPLADVEKAFDTLPLTGLYHNLEIDWIHPNDAGQAKMAEIVAAALQDYGYLEPATSPP